MVPRALPPKGNYQKHARVLAGWSVGSVLEGGVRSPVVACEDRGCKVSRC